MRESIFNNYVTLTFILLFLIIILRNAWVCDDSYITFRVIDNFVNGFGLRWNVDERVQAYSNPFWMLLLTPIYFFTREIYLTSIIISILLSVTAVVIIAVKLRTDYSWLVLGLSILICSNSFVDYSTSGLENALSYLLVIIFLTIYLTKDLDKKWFFLLFLSAGFVVFNRMDHGVVVFPFLMTAFFSYNKKTFNKYFQLRSVFFAIAGLLPFILWILFSIVYYGFPFPNTAYAKLNIGFERYLIVKQGFLYVLDFLKNDYIGASAVAVGLIFSFPVKKQRSYLPFFVSIIMYLTYIVWIGGDFMSGRFFTIIILLSAVVIVRQNYIIKNLVVSVPFIIGISLLSPWSSIFVENNKMQKTIREFITYEKATYFQYTGLFNLKPFCKKPVDPFANRGNKYGFVVIKGAIGFSGYNLGHKYHIIDRLALGDSLLSRIPYPNTFEKKTFIPGHNERDIPAGYVETIQEKQNKIEDPELKNYFEKLLIITRGEIFNFERFLTIIKMNSGLYNYLIAGYNNHKTYYAKNMRSDEKNRFLVYGPYVSLKKGNYRVDFTLRCFDNSNDKPIASIDVFSKNKVYESIVLKGVDFKKANEFEQFSLFFILSEDTDNMEFRVKYLDAGTLSVDTIRIKKADCIDNKNYKL